MRRLTRKRRNLNLSGVGPLCVAQADHEKDEFRHESHKWRLYRWKFTILCNQRFRSVWRRKHIHEVAVYVLLQV